MSASDSRKVLDLVRVVTLMADSSKVLDASECGDNFSGEGD